LALAAGAAGGAPVAVVRIATVTDAVKQRFHESLDALVEQVKQDRSILAAILCGSLSHDTVWAKSDIDLGLVTIDERKVSAESLALNADGVNVHAFLLTRAEFRKLAEGAARNSFMHSLLAKGRLLYAHDSTIADVHAQLSAALGERDIQLQLLRAGTHALPCIYKAHKWLLTRGDLEYTALWILYAAEGLARVEVISRRLLADREVIPQALSLNPAFFKTVYVDLLNAKKTRKLVGGALEALDGYMAERAPDLFSLVLEYLRDAGEMRSFSEIEDHFARTFDVAQVGTACEYLADQGLIGKAAVAARLTKRSTATVQELAFFSRS
jgi:hypothetical protein